MNTEQNDAVSDAVGSLAQRSAVEPEPPTVESTASDRLPDGTFAPDNTIGAATRFQTRNDAAIKTGTRSALVRSGAALGQHDEVTADRLALREELGDLGVVKVSLADRFVELSAIGAYLGHRLETEGPLTIRGRKKALLNGYLATIDRLVRVAQVLGIERHSKQIDLAQYVQQQAAANREQQS